VLVGMLEIGGRETVVAGEVEAGVAVVVGLATGVAGPPAVPPHAALPLALAMAARAAVIRFARITAVGRPPASLSGSTPPGRGY
jgi:hypothetical protein